MLRHLKTICYGLINFNVRLKADFRSMLDDENGITKNTFVGYN